MSHPSIPHTAMFAHSCNTNEHISLLCAYACVHRCKTVWGTDQCSLLCVGTDQCSLLCVGYRSVFSTLCGVQISVLYLVWGTDQCSLLCVGTDQCSLLCVGTDQCSLLCVGYRSVFSTLCGVQISVLYFVWGTDQCSLLCVGYRSVFSTLCGVQISVLYFVWGTDQCSLLRNTLGSILKYFEWD